MDKRSKVGIQRIKSHIAAMLDERRGLLQNGASKFAAPSKYWAESCSYFDYMLGLPEESFSKLRLHTYHLTGETYISYYGGGDPQKARQFRGFYDALTHGLPHEYWIDEPDDGIGFQYPDGHFVSVDSLRFQRAIRTLQFHGVIDGMKNKGGTSQVLEIGAGYGGLAHHLSRILQNAAYYIIDLPEALLFSAAYLYLHNPEKKLFIYEAGANPERIESALREGYDFLFIPSYRLELLRPLRLDLVINMSSLQEMRADQVQTYLEFIQSVCTGVFYSRNQDHQDHNTELGSLTDMLRAGFALTSIEDPLQAIGTPRARLLRRAARRAAVTLGLAERPPPTQALNPSREYLATPRASPLANSD